MNDKSNTDNNIIQPYQTFFDTSNMKLHQAMLCLQKSTLLLTQIQQKCSTETQLYIPQNYSTIQYFSAEQIDDFKANGVSHLIQNDTTYFRPDLPKSGVLVQARYCLDLEDLLQNYYVCHQRKLFNGSRGFGSIGEMQTARLHILREY